MGFDYAFTVLPPVDTEAFDAWHNAFGDEAPCADFAEGGSVLHVHGSYVRSSGYLHDYWPKLQRWVAGQGSKITQDRGDIWLSEFERTTLDEDESPFSTFKGPAT